MPDDLQLSDGANAGNHDPCGRCREVHISRGDPAMGTFYARTAAARLPYRVQRDLIPLRGNDSLCWTHGTVSSLPTEDNPAGCCRDCGAQTPDRSWIAGGLALAEGRDITEETERVERRARIDAGDATLTDAAMELDSFADVVRRHARALGIIRRGGIDGRTHVFDRAAVDALRPAVAADAKSRHMRFVRDLLTAADIAAEIGVDAVTVRRRAVALGLGRRVGHAIVFDITDVVRLREPRTPGWPKGRRRTVEPG